MSLRKNWAVVSLQKKMKKKTLATLVADIYNRPLGQPPVQVANCTGGNDGTIKGCWMSDQKQPCKSDSSCNVKFKKMSKEKTAEVFKDKDLCQQVTQGIIEMLKSDKLMAARFRNAILEDAQPFLGTGASSGRAIEEWVTSSDVTALLGISPRTLQTLRSTGNIPFAKRGNKIYYKLSDVNALLERSYNGSLTIKEERV